MSFEGARRLTDAGVLRALAHPVRWALLDALRLEGPLTATQAAEIVGESPASCSFHFRTLAKYGFVEEAEGGQGRQRPWRTVPIRVEIPDSDTLEGEAGIAAEAYLDILDERMAGRTRMWRATAPSYPPEWRAAVTFTSTIRYMTAEELQAFNDGIEALLEPYGDRTGPRPGALPVSIWTQAFPMRPPRKEDDAR